MRYGGTVIAVSDVRAAREFYEEVLGLTIHQDYGKNVVFTCGLALQQEFDWLVGLPKEKVLRESNNIELYFEEEAFDDFLRMLARYPEIRCLGDVVEHSWGQRVIRFYDLDGHIIEVGEPMKLVLQRLLAAGLSMDELARKVDASIADLEKLLRE